jgi:hypothetical protein
LEEKRKEIIRESDLGGSHAQNVGTMVRAVTDNHHQPPTGIFYRLGKKLTNTKVKEDCSSNSHEDFNEHQIDSCFPLDVASKTHHLAIYPKHPSPTRRDGQTETLRYKGGNAVNAHAK